MTEQEIKQIFLCDNTHREIWKRLGKEGQSLVCEILTELPADEFKELNPLAAFDITDVPIPYSRLICSNKSALKLTSELESKMSELLQDINTAEKNLEYPFAFIGLDGDEVDYFAEKPMDVGTGQACTYDWQWIEQFVANPNNAGTKLAIFHTHPNSLGASHNTLYNKYPQILNKVGVMPDGLNISLSDVYVMQYLDMLIEKHNAKITPEALILMHNGELVSFSSTGGLQLTGKKTYEKSLNNQKAEID